MIVIGSFLKFAHCVALARANKVCSATNFTCCEHHRKGGDSIDKASLARIFLPARMPLQNYI